MVEVVAGVFIREKKVLIARKKVGRSLAGYWEFPGGKVEAGESHKVALARELREEFAVDTQIGTFLAENTHDYGKIKVRLFAYAIEKFGENFVLRDHDQMSWVDREEIKAYQLAPADIPLVKSIFAYLNR